MSDNRILILEPPSPRFLNVLRDYAGGYGVAVKCSRSDYGHEGASAPYLSAFYIAGILDQSGYDVGILDCPAEQLSGAKALSRIQEYNPEIIISVISLPSLDGDLGFLNMVINKLPSVKIIAIGTVCKLLYDKILDQRNVVAAVRDHNEMAILSVVTSILDGSDLAAVPGIAYRDSDLQTHVNEDTEPLEDLDQLPMPPYHKLPMDRYRESFWDDDVGYMSIMQEKGCPYPCGSFCPYPFGFGKKPLYRSPELIVNEIQLLYDNYGIDAFFFRSQNFLMKKKHAFDICNELIRRKLKIRWACEARLDSIDPESVELMRAAGCEQIHFGLETGDPERFAAIGKPGSDLAVHGHAVEQSKKAGIFVKLMVIIGLPGETWETVKSTIRTIKDLKPDVVQAAILCPYPGTAVFDDARKKGLLITEDWSLYTGYDPVIRTESLSEKDLRTAQKMVQNSINYNSIPTRVVKKIRRMLSRVLINSKRHM